MKVYFWGAHGSLPASMTARDVYAKLFYALKEASGRNFRGDESIKSFIDNELPFWVGRTYGTNTCCVEIQGVSSEYILCDAGSGIRDFSLNYRRHCGAAPAIFHLFLSHLHWDHIHGFPFFSQIFTPGNKIIVHGHHEGIPDALKRQMSAPSFPISVDELEAEIVFDIVPPGESFAIEGVSVKTIEQVHPGVSYGYRFESEGKAVVYATDARYTKEDLDEGSEVVKFFKDADVLVFDAMKFSEKHCLNKEDWGHANNIMGAELSRLAKVKNMVLYHHDHLVNDTILESRLLKTLEFAQKYDFPKTIKMAYDGLVVKL